MGIIEGSDKEPHIGYVLGFRRIDDSTWTKNKPEDSDPQTLDDWAIVTSRREGVAEAWVSYYTPEDGTTRRYWINGQEDRTEILPPPDPDH
ncbi:hypothetical protein ACFY05_40475 [Microtetraspora fusca]|uniref:DUF3892 domain-containing protein n=1 Tax=Microtetraspora fusca TaxID=1997 RepID=A0ABW6VID2_MICFU